MKTTKDCIESLRRSMPEFWPRRDAEKYTNGLFKAQTLANLMYSDNPPPMGKFGGRAVVWRDEFLDWLETYYKGDDNGPARNCSGLRPRKKPADGSGKGSEEDFDGGGGTFTREYSDLDGSGGIEVR